METVLSQLSDFEVLRRVGSGATAHVYEAIRKNTGERRALKVVALQALGDPAALERVRREAVSLKAITHPGIVRLFGCYESADSLVLELEFVEGFTLSEWSTKNFPSLLEPKLWILAQLAQALAIAHMDEIIHRDLKPENILIRNDGAVKLSDFGLSRSAALECRVTQPGMIVGSLAYMAPELLSNGKCSFASDIFSFGVIAFELLTGRHPFPHEDITSLVEALKNEKPDFHGLPQMPARLGSLLLSCMSSEPALRSASLWEIHSELMAAIDQSGISAFCRPLIGHSEARENTLARAMEKKYSILQSKIELEAKAIHPDKKRLLLWINEFSLLFPDSQENQKFAVLFQGAREKKPIGRIGALAFLFVSLGILLAGYANKYRSPRAITRIDMEAEKMPAPAAPQAPYRHPVANAEPKAEAPKKNTIPTTTDFVKPSRVAEPEPARIRAAPPAHGVLNLKTAADVRVFIDGKRYGNSALNEIRLRPGWHHILLERDSFEPIEKKILIRSGFLTKINTGGGDLE